MPKSKRSTGQKKKISSSGQEYILDLPPMLHLQRASLQELRDLYGRTIKAQYFTSPGCDCSPGETCRWKRSSTHSSLLQREIRKHQPQVLRLSYWSTWIVRGNAQCRSFNRIFKQGRSLTAYIGGSSFQQLDPQDYQVRYCCANGNFWFIDGRNYQATSWLFHAEPLEDSLFQVTTYCLCSTVNVEDTFNFDHILRSRYDDVKYRRMVEHQFVQTSSFQTTPTLLNWPTRCAEDLAGFDAKSILSHLFCPNDRGLFRHIF